MFIGEIVEIGFIEPIELPETRPSEWERENEPTAPRPVQEPVPAR